MHALFWLFISNYQNCTNVYQNFSMISVILQNWKIEGQWWNDIPLAMNEISKNNSNNNNNSNMGHLFTLFVALLNSNYGLWNWNRSRQCYGFNKIVSTTDESQSLIFEPNNDNIDKFNYSLKEGKLISKTKDRAFHFEITVPSALKGKCTVAFGFPLEELGININSNNIKNKKFRIEIIGGNVATRYCIRVFVQKKVNLGSKTPPFLNKYYNSIVNGEMIVETKENGAVVLTNSVEIDKNSNQIVLSVVDIVGVIESHLDVYLTGVA